MSDWRDEAACIGQPVEWFFADEVRLRNRPRTWIDRAKGVCSTCPVSRECLDEVLRLPVTYDRVGIFGGTTAKERAVMRDALGGRVDRRGWEHMHGGPEGVRPGGRGRPAAPGSAAGRSRDTAMTQETA